MKKSQILAPFMVLALSLAFAGCAGTSSNTTGETNVLSNPSSNQENPAQDRDGDGDETATKGEMGGMNMDSQTAPALTPEQTQQLQAGETAHAPTTLTFTVNGGNFYFTPNVIKVKKGDTVKIVFKNDKGFHNWVLNEFNVTMNPNKGGETANLEFVADKTGSFEYYCSVGEHRAMGMKGTLIVE